VKCVPPTPGWPAVSTLLGLLHSRGSVAERAPALQRGVFCAYLIMVTGLPPLLLFFSPPSHTLERKAGKFPCCRCCWQQHLGVNLHGPAVLSSPPFLPLTDFWPLHSWQPPLTSLPCVCVASAAATFPCHPYFSWPQLLTPLAEVDA
jgi:hypothetical protein